MIRSHGARRPRVGDRVADLRPSRRRVAGACPGASRSRCAARRTGPADRPAPRTDQNSMIAHEQLLEKARAGGIDVYFVGDSITRRWGATDYPDLLAQLEAELLRLERRQLRLGRRPDAEHPVAPRERRARRRQSEGDRDPGRHQQRRRAAGRRRRRSPTSRAALTAILDLCRQKAPQRDDHPDRDLSAQRQHGRHAGDRSDQREPRAAGRRHARSATSMSTTSSPTRTGGCSQA